MSKRITFILFSVMLLFGCKGNHKNSDKNFEAFSEKFISEYLDWHPSYGVYLGLHQYDGKTTDYSKAGLDKQLEWLKSYDKQLAEMDSSTLNQSNYYDWRILRNAVKNDIFYFEDLQSYSKNPMTYANAADVNIYIKRNFAPLEQRIQSIINIENKTPEIIAAAKANLNDSLALPYINLSIDIARGSAGFLKNELVMALKDVKNDSLMKTFNEANQKAIAAMEDYASYLEKEKLPKAHNRYAIGKENFQKCCCTVKELPCPQKIF
ncbi:MAG: DUF885 family protein [Chitinophagales bacterium]